MAKVSSRSWGIFPIRPVVSALTLAFGGMAGANASEPVPLPEIKVKSGKPVKEAMNTR